MKIVPTIRENIMYKNYVEKCIRHNKPYSSFEDYLKVIKAYTNVLAGVLIVEGRATLAGTILTVELRREKKSVVDMLAMKQTTGKEPFIYNFNEHTFGYSASFGINDHGVKKGVYYKYSKTVKLKQILVKYLKSDPRRILKYRILNRKTDDNQ